MVSDEIMLKIENVSKIYKLGEIGGTTLRDELQRLGAKIRKKEDPTKKIGAKNYNKGEKFKALDNISFEVKKGERIGIIGHNGAGKSTLLKLISRVTGPTEGNIYLNGRVASMLEVGTGFHPELTGRENIYMNGAILGMTKKEIDAKMEDIIEFSEVRQFIDTPVKRYSSGMYVKLAFSVAAHLDSEIMIMDEVLAVGDVAFQNKCLNKMKEVSEKEDKTILYVSHNMNTIRQLCNRVIVLNRGTVIFDGDVNNGIGTYISESDTKIQNSIVLSDLPRLKNSNNSVQMKCLNFLNFNKQFPFKRGENILFSISVVSSNKIDDAFLRVVIRSINNSVVATSFSEPFPIKIGESKIKFSFDNSLLTKGKYFFSLCIMQKSKSKNSIVLDNIQRAACVLIGESDVQSDYLSDWDNDYLGCLHYPRIKVFNNNER
jgi:lipopolysaccharide transport system ATP-binding protein